MQFHSFAFSQSCVKARVDLSLSLIFTDLPGRFVRIRLDASFGEAVENATFCALVRFANTRKHACKYECDKFEDIKRGRGGMDKGRGEKGTEEGLTGVIRPERNGNVIVTDGPPSRSIGAPAQIANREEGREMKIYTEFKLQRRLLWRGFMLVLLDSTLAARYARLRSGDHTNGSVYRQYHRPTIASLSANCFRNFCVKCAFQLSANQRFHD